MKNVHRFLEVCLRQDPRFQELSSAEKRNLLIDLTKTIDLRFGRPLLPEKNETSAVTLDIPKTGALFFDRIWCPPALADAPPANMQLYGATEMEILPSLGTLLDKMPSLSGNRKAQEFVAKNLRMGPQPFATFISNALFAERGVNSVPMYSSEKSYQREHQPGTTQAIVAVVENLRIVDEGKLTWPQVEEFRKDSDGKQKLRRMRAWIDSEFSGKSVSQISDACATRLENYEWALKKHGIETVTGTLSDLLDMKFLPAASAAGTALAFTGGSLLAVVGTSSLIIGKMALSLTTRLINLKDRAKGKDSEVAFIHELKKL